MKYVTFSDQVHQTSRQLENLLNKASNTGDMLERMISPEDDEAIEVKGWVVSNGKILVTFESSLELAHASDEYERGLLDMLKRVFPKSIIQCESITIPYDELIG